MLIRSFLRLRGREPALLKGGQLPLIPSLSRNE